MKRDGICVPCILIQKAVPAVPPPPPHVRENSSLSSFAFSALRSQSSSGLTAPCFLHTYIPDANPCLLHLPNHPSHTLIQINRMTEGSDPTDDSRCCLFYHPDSVMPLICERFFEQIRGKCAHRDLCRYFPEKKRIGEGRRRL